MEKIIEIKEVGIKVGSGAVQTYECTGTAKITSKAIKKTKKCGASEEVVAVIVTGDGELSLELHAGMDEVTDMFGLKHGSAYAAKRGARRPDVAVTIKGADENDDNLLVSVPLAKVTDEEPTVIDADNGSTEIGYTSISLSYRPDTNGYGFYAVAEDDLPAAITADSWMTNFNATSMAIPVMSA